MKSMERNISRSPENQAEDVGPAQLKPLQPRLRAGLPGLTGGMGFCRTDRQGATDRTGSLWAPKHVCLQCDHS